MATLHRPRPAPAPPPTVAPPTAAACANCGTPAPMAYCPACGQEQREYHRSLRALAGELLDAFTGWDNKIVATFRTLLVRPGVLTREFLDGRRARYLRPLRVYLTASVLLFLALGVPSATPRPRTRAIAGGSPRPAPAQDARISVAGGAVAINTSGLDSIAPPPPGSSVGRRFGYALGQRLAAFKRAPGKASQRALDDAFMRHLGTTILLLVPVSAALVQLFWRRRRLFYAEHLVFALHGHAQGMLSVAVAHLLPGDLALVPFGWTVAYQWFALRRVYGTGLESRRRTAAKLAVAGLVYVVLLGVGMIVTFGVALLVAAV